MGKISWSLFFALSSSFVLGSGHSTAMAALDCERLRFADTGWTDIAATTALATTLLQSLGYRSKTLQISVPVTYASLKNKDIDLFLGNWMPSMAADLAPYQKEGSVITLGTVLAQARYTLAVPNYIAEAGVRSIADLSKFNDRFRSRIYAIEPGNDGNRLIQKMITENAFGLRNWKLVESSEQAMFMEVSRAVRAKKWVVFLAWEPHPINRKIPLTFLSGGDSYFGPHQGESTVFVNARRGFDQECPQVTAFLKKFKLDIKDENQLMEMILDQGMKPEEASLKWIHQNLDRVKGWMDGLKTAQGKPAAEAVAKLK